MAESTDIIFDIWKSHGNYLGKQSHPLHRPDISRYIADLFCPGEYYYYVIDSPTLTFDIVSPSTQKLLGIAAEDFSLQTLIEIIHPDDIQFMMKCEDVVAYFLKNCIPPEKMVKYKISYCLREKVSGKGYRLFLLQTVTMQTTKDGALLKVFGSHTDISHITNTNNKKLSLIGLDGEPSFLEINVFDEQVFNQYQPFDLKNIQTHPFTKRELDIIKQLSLGKTTDEIATDLFLSKNTVETHRRNILVKTNAKNTVELIVDCIRKGII